ncbi:MAG: clostripain-related cysteine peptidase [Lachnospiraceae bacterium]|nr:clostripain-related cysteine peptidase [Lachnospiraceae bacterium]
MERPRGRERGEIQNGKGVARRGEGLGTGPVGSKDGHQGRPGTGSRPGGSSGAGSAGRTPSSGSRRTGSMGGVGTGRGGRGGCGNPLLLIILAVMIFGGGGTGLLNLFQSGSDGSVSIPDLSMYQQTYGTGHNAGGGSYGTQTGQTTGETQTDLGELYNYISQYFGGDPSTYTENQDTTDQNTGTDGSEGDLVTEVAAGARAKRTVLKGGGKDTVTLMVYMCGTDLESRSGMATADLQEMAKASLGRLNILVYTGGCASWRNSIISSKTNQIYQVTNGGLRCLVSDDGAKSMTDPSTLSSFIKWCAKNYPANRNELILWDHGGGSLSGYGYDEKYQRSGSMTLAGINKALKDGGMTFDFIGFDACLMATAENALMLDSYADYLIASEETEPGVGWYYTDWLTKFAQNTSMETTALGKLIADDFVKVCAKICPGQGTTLSVIDLAEFSATVPERLSAFSGSITNLIQDKNYRAVSTARSRTREFAASTRIDQVDLADLAGNLGNAEGKALISAVQSAVKYNITNNITNASGVSIYFPYKSVRKVDQAVNTYDSIGMNEDYTKAIQAFASLEASGQGAQGGSGSPYASLFGLGNYGSGSYGTGSYSAGSNSSYSSYSSTGGGSELVSLLLNSFLGGDYNMVSGLGRDNTAFLSENVLEGSELEEYISSNSFNGSSLYWEEDENGSKVMTLTEEQWGLVHELDENLWYDDGTGYVDLGLDNVYGFDEQGRLVADTSKAWLGINGQPVAYYHESTEDDGTNYRVTGYIPCYVNGVRSNLRVVFDNSSESGYIAGVETVYKDGETETTAKLESGLQEGDLIDFVADYYDYDGNYQDSYMIGDQIEYDGTLELMNVSVGDGNALVSYRFTDLFNRAYWSELIKE